jgi:peroxiredoxin
LPHLQELWNENRNTTGFSMAVIGLREPNDALVQFKQDRGYTMPFVSDEDESVYGLFGLDGAIPHTCLLQNGVVRFSIAGYDENRFQQLKQHLGATLGLPETH